MVGYIKLLAQRGIGRKHIKIAAGVLQGSLLGSILWYIVFDIFQVELIAVANIQEAIMTAQSP